MNQVVLNDDQARLVAQSNSGVEFLDARGHLIACLTPEALEFARHVEIAKARRNSPGPRIPSERVQALLRKFHEIDANEGLSREKMQELLSRARAGEPL